MKRIIKFTSVYADDEVERVEEVDVPDGLDEEDLRDELWQYTGTGRTEGDAGYFAESIDGVEPTIDLEWC